MISLDAIMEENRLAAVARAEAEEERRHGLRLQNLAALKEQIGAHETAKVKKSSVVEVTEKMRTAVTCSVGIWHV